MAWMDASAKSSTHPVPFRWRNGSADAVPNPRLSARCPLGLSTVAPGARDSRAGDRRLHPQGQQRWAGFNWDCVAAGGFVSFYSENSVEDGNVYCYKHNPPAPLSWHSVSIILAIEPMSYFE